MSTEKVKINIKTEGYAGSYRIVKGGNSAPVLGPFRGPVAIELASGLYGIAISHGATVLFSVTCDGTVAWISGSETSKNELRFQTQEIRIINGRYAGRFYVLGAQDGAAWGGRAMTLLKGIDNDDYCDVGYILELRAGNNFRFGVSTDGTVKVNKFNAGAAKGEGFSLCLECVELLVEPVGYVGQWKISGAEEPFGRAGSRAVSLLPDTKGYHLSLPDGTSGLFDLNAKGEPSTSNLVIGNWRFKLGRSA